MKTYLLMKWRNMGVMFKEKRINSNEKEIYNGQQRKTDEKQMEKKK